MFSQLFLPLLLLASLPCLYAWKIDRSCQPYITTVRPAVEAAFENARLARDALSSPPFSPDVDRLVGHLFRGSAASPHQTDMKKAFDAFDGIVTNAGDEITGTPPLSATEVVFYCNLDRVVKRPDGRWLDQDSSTVFETIDEVEEHDVCKQERTALAYTWNPNPHQPMEGGHSIDTTNYPAQITICPWYLEWASKQPIKSIKDLAKLSTLAKIALPVYSFWVFDPIDKLMLTEKVLLHELTHTPAAGASVDVDIGSDGPMGFHGRAYGWKYCKRLADKNRENPYLSGLRNADSLALFASGVRLLHENPPLYITDGGSVTRTQPRKRWIDATNSSELEGFLTMVKDEKTAAVYTATIG